MNELDPKRCIKEVHERGFWHSHQCTKPRGKGKDGLYCGLHARMYAKREEEDKKCVHCKDTGHVVIDIPTTYHCGFCKNGCNKENCHVPNQF